MLRYVEQQLRPLMWTGSGLYYGQMLASNLARGSL